MLKLLVFPPSFGLRSPSPFSMKAIALMQMSGLDYAIENADPRKAPRKKLPVLLDGPLRVPDTAHIQAHLQDHHGIDFDGSLRADDLAIAQAFRCLMEDHLYWVAVYGRWIEHPESIREAFFGAVPAPLRRLVFRMVQNKIRAALDGHGMGRHTPEQIHAFGRADIHALAEFLGDKQFFFGETPTSIDATLYAMLTTTLVPPLEDSIKTEVLSHKNLVAYYSRFGEKFSIPQA
ncbi:MAG TPA: glutathione S-transferase family protein [Devosia sp.]|nr:glutathione S-transferase family protein [Devosia sp.]